MNSISENNANMTLVRPDMGILLGAKLPMSSFGLLALSFSQQIADRASCISAAHPMFSLEYLNEREAAATPAVISPVLKLDFSFILDQMRKLEDAREKSVPAPDQNSTVIYVDQRQTVTNETVYQNTTILQTDGKDGTAKKEPLSVSESYDTKKIVMPAAQPASNAQVMRLVEKAASMQHSGWGQPTIGRTAMGRDIRVITKPVPGAPGQTIRQLTAELVPAGVGEIYYIEDKTASERTENASAAPMKDQIEKHVSAKLSETSHKAKAPDSNTQKEQKVKDILPEQGNPVPVAAYLPDRPRNQRRITPAGMWMPVDTRRAPMTSPQMEMLFTNVIRAEQEMGLTYGTTDSGVPYAPQDRAQYLKSTTQLIRRREALAEAVYQIPPSLLPPRELFFLQQLAEQPGTPESVLYAAEQVVNRALELVVSVREPAPIQQESRTDFTGIASTAAAERITMPAEAAAQSEVRSSQIASPVEISYLSSAENQEQSLRPSETAVAAAEKQARTVYAAKNGTVPTASDPTRTGTVPAAVQDPAIIVNGVTFITEDSVQQQVKQPDSALESESKPLTAIPATEEALQQHIAAPTPVSIVSEIQSPVGAPVELSYIEQIGIAEQAQTVAAHAAKTGAVPPVSEPARTGTVPAAVQNPAITANGTASVTEGSVQQQVKQPASAPVSASKPLTAIPTGEEAVQQQVKQSASAPESASKPLSAISASEEAAQQQVKQPASAPVSASKPLTAISAREEAVQLHIPEPTTVPIIPGVQGPHGAPLELSYIEKPDLHETERSETASAPRTASDSRTASVQAEHPSVAVGSGSTDHVIDRLIDRRDTFHVISNTAPAARPQTRIKILQRLRTVFRGAPAEASRVETAPYSPVELIEQTNAVQDSLPFLMQDQEFRNGIQLLERIVSKTMTVRLPQSDTAEAGLPRSITELSEVNEPMNNSALPFAPAAEIVYQQHAAPDAPIPVISGVLQNAEPSFGAMPPIADGPAQTSYIPQPQIPFAAPDGASSGSSEKPEQTPPSHQRSGIVGRRDRRREERQKRKAGRSSIPSYEHTNRQPIPTSDVSAPETVFLTPQSEPRATAASAAQTTQPLPMQVKAASHSEDASPLQMGKLPQSSQQTQGAIPLPMHADFSEEPIYVTQTQQQTEFTERRQTIERERFSTRLKTSVVRQPTVKETVRVPQPPEIRYINAAAGAAPAREESVSRNNTQEPVRQSFLKPEAMNSEYVQNLPDWAKDFLQNGYEEKPEDSRPMEPQGIPASDQISWTNPAADAMGAKSLPPQEIDLKQKTETKPASPQISEAELRRTADRVYKIIEDRLRSERRRHGW